ncbi:hypothetical protein FPOAC1_000542 [Fusarium poae]|uniref:hypothetical protein n=1 Tax=Fusarium poae TaxID=36050 RepID=UPI001CEBEA99|nr:hypothetical protein FPOAC1_000542 [Fusarium poae]KAG8674572.1 hypothetical protein FPOAC1_000542 [Fusarium poae]
MSHYFLSHSQLVGFSGTPSPTLRTQREAIAAMILGWHPRQAVRLSFPNITLRILRPLWAVANGSQHPGNFSMSAAAIIDPLSSTAVWMLCRYWEPGLPPWLLTFPYRAPL